jgi:hypothetical protein
MAITAVRKTFAQGGNDQRGKLPRHNWSQGNGTQGAKTMSRNKSPDDDQGMLRDEELELVIGGAIVRTAQFVGFKSPGFAALSQFQPHLLPPSPC